MRKRGVSGDHAADETTLALTDPGNAHGQPVLQHMNRMCRLSGQSWSLDGEPRWTRRRNVGRRKRGGKRASHHSSSRRPSLIRAHGNCALGAWRAGMACDYHSWDAGGAGGAPQVRGGHTQASFGRGRRHFSELVLSFGLSLRTSVVQSQN